MALVYRWRKAHGLEYRNEAPHLVEKRLAEGWSTSKAVAIAAKTAVPVASAAALSDDVGDDAPPTRDELERKAAELRIKVDRRWSDKTLAERIETALKG
jgi:hypothetical protein